MKNKIGKREIGKTIKEYLKKCKDENCSVEPADVYDDVSNILMKQYGVDNSISGDVVDYMQDHDIDEYFLYDYFDDAD